MTQQHYTTANRPGAPGCRQRTTVPPHSAPQSLRHGPSGLRERVISVRRALGLVLTVAAVGSTILAGCAQPGAFAPTATVAPAPTSIPATPTSASTPVAQQKGTAVKLNSYQLVVEEYPVVDKTVASPDRIEYSKLIDPQILEKRRAWREPSPAGKVAGVNRTLERFGYRLVPKEKPGCPICTLYDLYRGDAVVQQSLNVIQSVSVNAAGDDFALLVETESRVQFLVRRDTVDQWDPVQHGYMPPVYAGDTLVTVNVDYEASQVIVRSGDQTLFTTSLAPAVDNPLRGLWSWDGRWVLEVDGQVVVDGKSLNEDLGCEEVFGWHLLAGEPFYFFKKDGRIGISFGGQALRYQYDEVIHYQCCEPSAFNVRANDMMVWFHALRDGKWYYVEAPVLDGADVTWEALARSKQAISPMLRPDTLPEGLETIRVLKSGWGAFQVEYLGGGKLLGVAAGPLNPPLVGAEGERRSVMVRGQQGTLQVQDKAHPSESVQLWWEEPGKWTPAPGMETRDKVLYLVSGEGLTPEEVMEVAQSLQLADVTIDNR